MVKLLDDTMTDHNNGKSSASGLCLLRPYNSQDSLTIHYRNEAQMDDLCFCSVLPHGLDVISKRGQIN